MYVRLGLFGWLCLGWVIIPCWLLFQGFKGVVCIFLALMKALDKHNRRRAVRKAYERDRASRRALWDARQTGQPWPPPGMPQRQFPWAPQDRIPIQWQDEHGNWRTS